MFDRPRVRPIARSHVRLLDRSLVRAALRSPDRVAAWASNCFCEQLQGYGEFRQWFFAPFRLLCIDVCSLDFHSEMASTYLEE